MNYFLCFFQNFLCLWLYSVSVETSLESTYLEYFKFMKLEVLLLLQICGISSPFLFKKLLLPFLFLFFFWVFHCVYMVNLVVSHRSHRLSSYFFILFFILLFWLDNFEWPVFELVLTYFVLHEVAMEALLLKFSVQS